jgi:ribosomal protein S18 acetylase RimI-like enzyme
MTIRTIKTAMSADEAALMDVVTLALSTDPDARWLYPDPHQYLLHFPHYVKALGGNAFGQGSAYYIDGYAGVALWLPPHVHPEEDALVALLQRTIAERDREEVVAVIERIGSYYPTEPHWYLPFIGVDPVRQGQGHGSALLQHALMACDRDHTLAYLETSNPKNVPLYKRHGFEILGTIQVGASPSIFPMLRKPR